jgi:chlorobactene glucosyltransferase
LEPDLIYLLWATLFLILGVIIVHWIHSQYGIDIDIPPCSSGTGTAQPLISIIVPARNEARNIQRCIEGLQSQTYSNLETIIVDDGSTDATPDILDQLQTSARDTPQRNPSQTITILTGFELPPGWAGKSHALHQGYQASQGEWLCFIDADTFANPQLISSTYQTAINLQADMLSILTYQELGGFWEKVILPLVFSALSVGFPADRVNDTQKADAIANGQFILIKRSVYEAVGGHEAVRDQIAEDKALAVLVKGAGYRLILGDGRELARTRMYTSLPEIWEGWVKNIYLGMQDRLGLLLVGAITGLVAALALPLWTMISLAGIALGGGWIAVLTAAESLVLWGYLLYNRSLVNRAMGISTFYGLTLPLGALIFSAMMLTSVYRVISGMGVTWRGRTYS